MRFSINNIVASGLYGGDSGDELIPLNRPSMVNTNTDRLPWVR
jgi:hypothetical protein